MFKIKRTTRFDKQYAKFPKNIQQMIDNTIIILEQDPYYPSLRTKKFERLGCFECSINMNYRILWEYEDDEIILLLAVGNHDMFKRT